jgi:hypothetical protein
VAAELPYSEPHHERHEEKHGGGGLTAIIEVAQSRHLSAWFIAGDSRIFQIELLLLGTPHKSKWIVHHEPRQYF